jgi:hypothetical protein
VFLEPELNDISETRNQEAALKSRIDESLQHQETNSRVENINIVNLVNITKRLDDDI